jgi:uncharacterized protein YsxB (DUF464 family)
MLNVVFTAKDDTITMVLNGHAGQADIGHDIVCSSCSILAYTVAQIVKTEEKEGSLKTKPLVVLNKGSAIVSCEPKPEKYNELRHAFYVAEVGYTLLSHNYPQLVDFTPFGEPEKA